jgi:methyl-accepting chemotaxis protein-1 (serine sensor receptor)
MHQAKMLEALERPYESKLELGGRILRIVANPLFDEDGERLGTAMECGKRLFNVLFETSTGEAIVVQPLAASRIWPFSRSSVSGWLSNAG